MKKKFKYFHNFTEPSFRREALALGQIMLAWNDLHEKFCFLFYALMGGGVINQMTTVWSAVTSDRQKREMIRAAMQNEIHNYKIQFPKLVEDITWLLKKAENLEDDRNNAAHSPLTLARRFGIDLINNPEAIRNLPFEPIPDIVTDNIRARKLFAKNTALLPEFKRCRDTAIILRDYCHQIENAIRGARVPWPSKPRLPNRGQKKPPRQPQGSRRVSR